MTASWDGDDEPEVAPGTYAGDYVIGAPIGRGVFGTVYAARHPVIGAPAAVKVLRAEYARDPAMIARFVDEAKAASLARHPSIVEVFNFGRLPDGRRFIVMERLEGEGLDARIAREAPFTVGFCAGLLAPVAAALEAAHAAGVTHRDVKPANIFVCEQGPPKLLDFGVAELLEAGGRWRGAGTPAYMSPEQCEGAETTPAADVYALGVVAWQMLAGRLPFEGDAREVVNAHIGDPPPRLDRVRPDLSRATARAVAAMLAKDPAARPTPTAAIEALAASARRPDRTGRLVALAGLLAVGLLAAGGWWWSVRPPATEPAARVVDAAVEPPAGAARAARADAAVERALTFTLLGLPDDAEAHVGDAPLEVGPGGVLRLDRQALPAAVTLSAPGHAPRALDLDGTARTLDARLEPLPTPTKRRRKDPDGIDPW